MLPAAHISFGLLIKKEARARALPVDRESLQDLGDALIAAEGEAQFVRHAIASQASMGETTAVFDSVRHVSVWRAIQDLHPRAVLIYQDVEGSVALARLCARDGITLDVARGYASHAMELKAQLLRQHADLVIGPSTQEEGLQLACTRIHVLERELE